MVALVLGACSGPSGEMRRKVNAQIAAGDFSGAVSHIQRGKLTSYGAKNAVLYYLDLGAVQHDAGRYKESDANLALAESRIDQLYTKSVSKASATLLLNNNTVDYVGGRFERALVNVYRALDFLWLGDRENALVEIRKLTRLLQEYADTLGTSSSAYKDDAFAQYLSSLLYADDGHDDDSRISLDAAQRAYARYATAYGTSKPQLSLPPSDRAMGELVFIHLNGVAPRKVSQSFQVAWNEAVATVDATKDDEAQAGQAKNALRAGLLGRAITVAFPAYVQDPYSIMGSVVEVDGQTQTTELVEDVSAIAQKDLAEHLALIKTQAIARATIKYILTKATVDKTKKKYGDNSLQALAAGVAAAALAGATEVADTRAWATLPAQFRMARMRVPIGEHSVTIHYVGAGGADVLMRSFKVKILEGQRAYLHDRTAL